MATGATGTPTSKGIPKYATSSDAPNGTGFNSAMDAIDTLLDGYVLKPSGIASGEVPVWNGTAWVRSSVTRIGVGSLGSGTPDSTNYLRGDGSWQAVTGAPTGAIVPYAGLVVPSGYLACDGASVSKTTYAALWGAVSSGKGTITVTIASPAVVTLNAHGFVGGEQVHFATTGALPTGLSALDTNYFVIYVDANTFRLASSVTNYLSSTAINTSGSQSGTHTLIHAAYGIASSTNFLVPDLRGRMLVGKGTHADVSALGLDDTSAIGSRRPKHKHTTSVVSAGDYALDSLSGGASNFGAGSFNIVNPRLNIGPQTSVPTDAPAYLTASYIIKT